MITRICYPSWGFKYSHLPLPSPMVCHKVLYWGPYYIHNADSTFQLWRCFCHITFRALCTQTHITMLMFNIMKMWLRHLIGQLSAFFDNILLNKQKKCSVLHQLPLFEACVPHVEMLLQPQQQQRWKVAQRNRQPHLRALCDTHSFISRRKRPGLCSCLLSFALWSHSVPMLAFQWQPGESPEKINSVHLLRGIQVFA